MFRKLYPTRYVHSTYGIDFEALYSEGKRGIIFDIDNTLVPHGYPADDRAIELMKKLKSIGYQVLFLSNNKEPRVKMFNDAVDCQYIYKAGKPSKNGVLKSFKMMGTDKSNTILVGDQLFTDIWCANNSGIDSILVKPIDKKEEIQIILKRIPEKLILLFYRTYCLRKGRVYLEK
ncbi:MAG: YqeG family HAD IIIA-type phosphatase [Lachnospiraceae bacterium]|nr:YqeG family HAD IIIA-type phosphatase [Lachnospiraceae bacterium]